MTLTGLIKMIPYFCAIFWLKVVFPESESPTKLIFNGIYNGMLLLTGAYF